MSRSYRWLLVWSAALTLSLALAGCSLALDFDDECTLDFECASGLVCRDGLCVSQASAPTPELLTEHCPTLHGVSDLESNTVLFGTLLPLSGALAQFGPPMQQAVFLAVDEINNAGGLFGRRVAVLACDTQSDASLAAVQARHLDAVGVEAVIGAASSAVTIGVFTEVAKNAGMLLISPASTSPQLTNLPDDDLLWRTVPSDATQGSVIGEYILHQQYERVALISIDDAYGSGLRDAIVDRICADGSGFSCDGDGLFSRTFASGTYTSDHADALVAMQNDGFVPDVTVLIAFPKQGANYITAAADASARYLLPDGMRDVGLFCQVPDEVLCQAFGTAPLAPSDDAYNSFAIRYRSAFGAEPGTFTAQSYDALYLLAYAFAATGGDNPTGLDLAAGLKRLSEGEQVPAGGSKFNSAIQTLAVAGQTIDYRGASGELNFDSGTGEAPAPLEAWYFDIEEREIRSLGEALDLTGGINTSVFDALPACPTPPTGVCE